MTPLVVPEVKYTVLKKLHGTTARRTTRTLRLERRKEAQNSLQTNSRLNSQALLYRAGSTRRRSKTKYKKYRRGEEQSPTSR